MKSIDINTWNRHSHFELFNSFDYPHFNITAPIDIENFANNCRKREISFTVATAYLFAKSANELESFRYRIRSQNVILHEVVHPSFTIMTNNELFSYCTVNYEDDFSKFYKSAKEKISLMKKKPSLSNKPWQDELIYMTAIPWVSFTSFVHPIHMNPVDSVPLIAWGKYYQDGNTIKMPVSVQVHHALMDGQHVAEYFENMKTHFKNFNI
ncbi:MAG: chloramphenicol acetyltransferase [Candidatus Marinimicrobia bacterium]|nr:chloramphenicol acetyltransferase [Candidatus Neomarinimicrobiota bacterium]